MKMISQGCEKRLIESENERKIASSTHQKRSQDAGCYNINGRATKRRKARRRRLTKLKSPRMNTCSSDFSSAGWADSAQIYSIPKDRKGRVVRARRKKRQRNKKYSRSTTFVSMLHTIPEHSPIRSAPMRANIKVEQVEPLSVLMRCHTSESSIVRVKVPEKLQQNSKSYGEMELQLQHHPVTDPCSPQTALQSHNSPEEARKPFLQNKFAVWLSHQLWLDFRNLSIHRVGCIEADKLFNAVSSQNLSFLQEAFVSVKKNEVTLIELRTLLITNGWCTTSRNKEGGSPISIYLKREDIDFAPSLSRASRNETVQPRPLCRLAQ